MFSPILIYLVTLLIDLNITKADSVKNGALAKLGKHPSDVVLLFPSDVKKDEIEKTLAEMPENKNVSLVIGSALVKQTASPRVFKKSIVFKI